MLSEMEVTGQAFEYMQEQNVRLLQQLREKDDANFKLMSEVRRCLKLYSSFACISVYALRFQESTKRKSFCG